jgi:hypothetical protein
MISAWGWLRVAVLAVAFALLLAGCGSARHAPQAHHASPESAQGLSLYASCADWNLASPAERRAFTDRLYDGGSSGRARARGGVPADELRLLIALHCAGGGAAGTQLGLIVVNAVVGTLGTATGRGG